MKTIRLHPKAAEGSAEGMLNIGQKIKFYFGSLFYGEQVGHVAKDGTCLFRKAGKKQISNVEGKITETFDTVVDLNGPILRPVKRGCMRKTPISVDRNGTGVYAVDRKLEVRGENGWEVAKSKPQKPEIEPQELAQSGSIYLKDANDNMRPLITSDTISPYRGNPHYKVFYYRNGQWGYEHVNGNSVIPKEPQKWHELKNNLGAISPKVRLNTCYWPSATMARNAEMAGYRLAI